MKSTWRERRDYLLAVVRSLPIKPCHFSIQDDSYEACLERVQVLLKTAAAEGMAELRT